MPGYSLAAALAVAGGVVTMTALLDRTTALVMAVPL